MNPKNYPSSVKREELLHFKLKGERFEVNRLLLSYTTPPV